MIAKMSKYDFVLYKGQKSEFIERLRELGLVDITTTGWEPSEQERQLLLDIEGYGKALSAISAWREEHEAATAEAYANADEAYEAYLSLQQRNAATNSELAKLEKMAEELRPWGEFSVEQIKALEEQGYCMRFFFTSTAVFEEILAGWSLSGSIFKVGEEAGNTYFVVVETQREEFPYDAQEMKSPAMDIRGVESKISELQEALKLSGEEFKRVVSSESILKENLISLKEQLQESKVVSSAEEAADGSLLILQGWAEAETSEKVDQLLNDFPNVVYLKSDPTPEDDTPVQLKNGWFARIFEMVGDMYARPKYGTLDLTPFFAPFYMLFFGICLNDAGYGLVLLALGVWMLMKNKEQGMMRRAAWFATLCAISTTLFGGFCGSFFGVSLSELFGYPSMEASPFFDFQGKFFSWALAIGMFQILFGLLLNIYMTIRVFGLKYSFANMGWFIILISGSLAGGLQMLNENWVIPGFTTSSPAFYAALILGAVLMLLLNTPGKFHNPAINIGSGLWNLYNNITGLLSDVLSYIRLFAIGLSGGVLAVVFNSLASGFVPDEASILTRILVMLPILLIGHGINLFMSTISSFVHPMRLTFVEFYKNAGFEMASRNFEPLKKEN